MNSTYLADISSLIPRSRNRLVNVTPVVPVISSGYLKHTRKTQSSETTAKLLKRGHQVSSNLSETALVFLYCPVFICIILPRIASGRETHVVWRVRPGCIVKYFEEIFEFQGYFLESRNTFSVVIERKFFMAEIKIYALCSKLLVSLSYVALLI